MTELLAPEAQLVAMGITLPDAPPAVGVYRSAQRIGDVVHLAGHGPLSDGKPTCVGRVGDDVTVEQAADAARVTMLNLLASLRAEIGSLDRVRQIVHVFGMVRATEDFQQHPAVIDGASILLGEIFGERGVHTRSAVGMHSLPYRIAVEIEMSVQFD